MQPRKALTLMMFLLMFTTTPFLYGQTSEADENPNQGDLRLERVSGSPLIGSWVIDVQSEVAPFNAFHTFHAGGTMSETTNLLATLSEGPAHGAWQKDGDGYATTFELFIFEADHTPAGRIRVRETITLIDNDHLTGIAVADLLLPDGTIIENIDNGPMTGTRVPLEAVRPEEIGSAPIATTRMPARRAW